MPLSPPTVVQQDPNLTAGTKKWLHEFYVHSRYKMGVHLRDYMAAGDGTTDDFNAIQSAIDAVNSDGGGYVFGRPGDTYNCTESPIIKPNVILDLNGATLKLSITGTGSLDAKAYGVRLRSFSAIQNGTVNMVSAGSVGSQGGYHAAINVGHLSGDGGTTSAPSSDHSVKNWRIENLTVSTDRAGKAGIKINGESHLGIIKNIDFPDSSTMHPIKIDWDKIADDYNNFDLGTPAEIDTARTAFDAGEAYTTHPHNIVITNVKIGAMTHADAFGIRLSGCHAIHINTVVIDSTTDYGFFHTAGDVGYEFAEAAVKPFAHRGIFVGNFLVKNATTGYGFWVDGDADNLQTAIDDATPYAARTLGRVFSDIHLSHCQTYSGSGASANSGIRVQKIDGALIEDCHPQYHTTGILIEENARNVEILRCAPENNREDGIKAAHASSKPEKCTVRDCKPKNNGTNGGTQAGILLDGATDCAVINNYIGGASEGGQANGIKITSSCTGITVKGNHVADTNAGTAYIVSSSTDYDCLELFADNTADSGITTFYGGVDILPFAVTMDTSGNKVRMFRSTQAVLSSNTTPTAGAWEEGDCIFYTVQSASDYVGTVCITAGSQGTWKRFGATTA